VSAELLGPALAAAAGGALLAGLVRGFSGFGGAMVLVPILAASHGPQVAVPVLVLIDFVLTLPLAWRARRRCAWREVAPVALGHAAALPAGLAVLVLADPTLLTRATGGLVLAMAAAMALGLRRTTPPRRGTALGIGLGAGLLSGSTGVGGPPVVLFWLAGPDAPPRMRANLMVFFALSSVLSLTGLAVAGVITAAVAALALLLWPAYALGLLAGGRLFTGADARLYRPLALVIVAGAGLTALLGA
jgi:hypothetical protein